MTKKRISGLKIILTLVLGCGVIWVFIWLFGTVRGQEFSPNRFVRRDFSYCQIPFFGKQITPVSFSKPWRGTTALETHLRTSGYLSSVRSKAVRWDIITISEPGRPNDKGDAEILTKYLDQPGAVGGESWLDWSKNKQHAEIAATFWPLVAELAYHELYILLPDVFDMARRSSSVDEFLATVHRQIPQAIRKVAEAEKLSGEPERSELLETFASNVEVLEATPYEPAEKDKDGVAEPNADEVEAEADPEQEDALM